MPIPKQQPDSFPKTAKERVYSVMREWIVDGTLKPEEKIYDKDIAEYFSVSRTPVREAFQMLAEQQLIIISPGKESRVSSIDPKSIKEAYEILASLEAIAIKYATANISPSELSALKETTEALKRAMSDGDAKSANAADHQFHETILKLSGNTFLYRFCDALETYVSRMEYQVFSGQGITELLPQSLQEHEQMISAIEAGDEALAMKAMSENWLHTISHIEALQ